MVRKVATIHSSSMVTDGFGDIHYLDVYQVHKPTDATLKEIFDEVMRLPAWATALFKLRNAIVGISG